MDCLRKKVLRRVVLECQPNFSPYSWTSLPRIQICYLAVCLIAYVELSWLWLQTSGLNCLRQTGALSGGLFCTRRTAGGWPPSGEVEPGPECCPWPVLSAPPAALSASWLRPSDRPPSPRRRRAAGSCQASRCPGPPPPGGGLCFEKSWGGPGIIPLRSSTLTRAKTGQLWPAGEGAVRGLAWAGVRSSPRPG